MVGKTVQNLSEFTLKPLFESFNGMSGLFVETGMYFLAFAIALSLISGIYRWWISGSFDDLAANLVRAIIIVGPLLIVLNGWPRYVGQLNVLFTKELASIVSGGKEADIFAVVGKTAQKVMDSAKVLTKEDPKEKTGKTGSSGTSGKKDDDSPWWEDVADAVAGAVKDAITSSVKKLMGIIISAFIFILSVLLVFGLMFAVFMPAAGLYIGGIFGPLIISWLPWQPLAGMAARWLSFMISNGFSILVALVIVRGLGVTIDGLVKTLAMMVGETGTITLIAAYATTLVAILAIYLFSTNLALQANNMADAMTGGASVGEGLLGKVTSAMGAAGMLRGGSAVAKTHGTIAKAASNAPGALGKVASAVGMPKTGEKLQNLQGKIDKAKEKASTVLDKVKNSELYRNFNQPINKL